MPFRSRAQVRKFFAAERDGELPKGTARKWARHTPDIKQLPERVEKQAMLNIKGLGQRLQARLQKALPGPLTATPARSAATAGVGATAAGIGANALFGVKQHGDDVQVQRGVNGANQALQGMLGKMETPVQRQSPAMAPSASGTTKSPGNLSGARVSGTGAKIGLVGGLGLAAGFGAGAMAGRRKRKPQPGKLGKTSMVEKSAAASNNVQQRRTTSNNVKSVEKIAASDAALMGAGAAAFPLVGGIAGALHGAAKAPRGRRLRGAGRGAVAGAGGGLGALVGLTAGSLGGLSAGAALEGAGHPLAGQLAQKTLSLGGAMGGAHLGHSLAERLTNGDDDDDGMSFKYGSDRGSLLTRHASRAG